MNGETAGFSMSLKTTEANKTKAKGPSHMNKTTGRHRDGNMAIDYNI